MADSTSSTIEIAAEPGAVLDVIADFEAYPEWAGQVKDVTVLTEDGDGWADQVEYVLDAGAIKDTYVLKYDWDDIEEDGTGAVSGVGADAHAPVEGVDDEEDYDVDADGVVTEREPSFA